MPRAGHHAQSVGTGAVSDKNRVVHPSIHADGGRGLAGHRPSSGTRPSSLCSSYPARRQGTHEHPRLRGGFLRIRGMSRRARSADHRGANGRRDTGPSGVHRADDGFRSAVRFRPGGPTVWRAGSVRQTATPAEKRPIRLTRMASGTPRPALVHEPAGTLDVAVDPRHTTPGHTTKQALVALKQRLFQLGSVCCATRRRLALCKAP